MAKKNSLVTLPNIPGRVTLHSLIHVMSNQIAQFLKNGISKICKPKTVTKAMGASWMSPFYHHETVIHHISNKGLNICDASRWSELGDCHLAIYITASTSQSCQTVFVVERGSLGTGLHGIKLVSILLDAVQL